MNPEGMRRGYDAVAEAYADEFRHELDRKPFDRLILERFAHLTAGGAVCEIGSGPAQVSAHLLTLDPACRPARVLALDLSHPMLVQARRLAPEAVTIQADMGRFPFRDGVLDGLFAFYAIVHCDLPQIASVLAEWRRALKPNGWLLLTFHCGKERIHLDEFLGKPVDMEWIFADPAAVLTRLDELGFRREICAVRYPYPGDEHPSQRAYFLVQRSSVDPAAV